MLNRENADGGFQCAPGASFGGVFLLQSRRQVLGLNGFVLAEQNGPLDAVLQLPHISGPVITDEEVYRRR